MERSIMCIMVRDWRIRVCLNALLSWVGLCVAKY